jgi:predicted nucleic acid-binding protein
VAIYYIDSSGIVKRYANEVGSAWIVSITDPAVNNEIYVVRTTGVEVVSALTRLMRGGAIDPADAIHAIATFENDFQNEYNIVEVTETLVNSAIALAKKHGLRGYDAMQLAAACEIHALCTASGLPPLTFVSADTELNTAATVEGLAVDDPNLHP